MIPRGHPRILNHIPFSWEIWLEEPNNDIEEITLIIELDAN